MAESETAMVSLKCAGRTGEFQLEGLKPYIGEYKPEQQVRPGETVIAHTDLTQRSEVVGRAYRVRRDSRFRTLVASLDMAIVRPTIPGLSGEFLSSALEEERFRVHTLAFTNGTTVVHLGSLAVPSYSLLLPRQELVETFTNLTRPMERLKDNLLAECQTLAWTRDILLPKLLSGEIRLPTGN